MAKRKWNAEDKQKIILSGLRNETSIAELCRRHGIKDAMYYKWKKEFLESGLNGLKGNGKLNSRETFLQQENEQLKALIGELTVENRFLKKIQGS